MIDTRKIKKLLILNIPYFILGLLASNFGEAWRIAGDADSSAKSSAFFLRSLLYLGILCRAFIHLICSLVLSAALVYGLQYICEEKMRKSTVMVWSMVQHDGVHNFKCKGTLHGRTGGYAHD